MIEKIIEYYNEIPKKKYFLLKVAVSTRKKQRKLVHAIAIPTDTQIEGLKECIYNNFEYKEFLIKSEDFLNLISKRQEIIEIDGFKIPYTENPQVDERFIPTAEDFYDLSKPYELFRIRVGGESYAYGPLSHPELPNYSSFYPFIREHMGYDIQSGGAVDFCVLFPVEKAHMENLKITRSKIKFDVVGDLNNLNCTYYLKTEKEERKDKFDPKKINAIKYRGRIKEIELTLWHSKKKLDYIRTRHADSKKLSKDSYWSKSDVWPTDVGDEKEDKKSWQENILLYIIIGVLISVIGWVIVNFVSGLF
jgi:hypothetical protein